MLKAALAYANAGYSIIPVGTNKLPVIKEWKKFQDLPADTKQINAWWAENPDAQIAVICGKNSGITVIDADSDEAIATLNEYLPESVPIPTVKTSKGLHFYFKHDPEIPNINQKKNTIPDCDVKSEGGYVLVPPSKNQKGSYTWMKGLKLSNTALPEIPEFLKSVLLSKTNAIPSIIDSNSLVYSGARTRVIRDTQSDNICLQDDNECKQVTTSDNILCEGSRDEELFHLANCLVKGGMAEAEIYQYLEIFAKNCKPPYPEKDIPIKIRSALTRKETRTRNLTQEIFDLVRNQSGTVMTTFVYNCLQLTTREEKKHAAIVLGRMTKPPDNILERTGRVAGEYRIVEKNYTVTRLSKVSKTRIDIKLPFGLERYCGVKPKNLVVFAGVPNAGKTALLLNCAKLNMFGPMKVWFWSFEADEEELLDTVSNDNEYSLEVWDKVTFVDDPPNYYDIIKPDDINIIDYVTARGNQEAYDIPKILNSIREKLNKGIAIIALQKNKNKSDAVGGEQTRAAARLMCNVDPLEGQISRILVTKSKIKGEVCKREKFHPEGLSMRFQTEDGINLIPIDRGWGKRGGLDHGVA